MIAEATFFSQTLTAQGESHSNVTALADPMFNKNSLRDGDSIIDFDFDVEYHAEEVLPRLKKGASKEESKEG